MNKPNPKIIVQEVVGSASSGKEGKRLGFRVTEIYNTTDYRIGQDLYRVEVDEARTHGGLVFVIRGQIYSDKVITNPVK